jgi:hypothetical protein
MEKLFIPIDWQRKGARRRICAGTQERQSSPCKTSAEVISNMIRERIAALI